MAKQRPAQATRTKTIARDKAVISVIRNDLSARTGGMPAFLREKILAAARPAPRQRKKPETFFFNLGWTGALLAAALTMAVGVAWYQNRIDVQALKAPAPLTVWDTVQTDARALLFGAAKNSDVAGGDAKLATTLKNWDLGGGLASDEAELLWVRGTPTDVGHAAWFVFSVDGERIAALLAPGSSDLRADERRSEGRLMVGFPLGKKYVVLVGRDAGRLDAFRRSVKLLP